MMPARQSHRNDRLLRDVELAIVDGSWSRRFRPTRSHVSSGDYVSASDRIPRSLFKHALLCHKASRISM